MADPVVIISSDSDNSNHVTETPTEIDQPIVCDISFERQRVARRDFISSDSDGDLPDLTPQIKKVEVENTRPSLTRDRSFEVLTYSDTECSSRVSTETAFTYNSAPDSQNTNLSECSSLDRDSQVSGTGAEIVPRRRTKEEVAEKKLQAKLMKEKRIADRLNKKKEKDEKKSQDAKKRKLISDVNKQTRVTDCIKYMTVLVDESVVSCEEIVKALQDGVVSSLIQGLPIRRSIQWKRRVSELSQRDDDSPVDILHSDILENQILLVIPVNEFTEMISTVQTEGNLPNKNLVEYIRMVQTQLPLAEITLVCVGMNKYFAQQAKRKQRNFRDTALDEHARNRGGKSSKSQKASLHVTRFDLEKAVTECLLVTGSNIQLLDSLDDLIRLVKSFTKAIAEIPIKQHRLDTVLPFHCESLPGAKVEKDGRGLLKNWKNQLRQFRSLSSDMADAITSVYPSPQLLFQEYAKCSDAKTAERLLENIQVRRGAGLLETNRRIGKELSRRIYQHMTSTQPDTVVT